MPLFRKKPVVIEAIQCSTVLDTDAEGWEALPFWLKVSSGRTLSISDDDITIATLEGQMLARRDDWIIRGIAGELYPCKPDIFELTYEPVEDNNG